MAQTTALKRRITSVKNTRQITKAMELVAASKMRRAQETAAKSRDYSKLARQILTRLRQLTDVNAHPLYRKRTIKTRLHIIATSDRGLAGAYNSNVLRYFSMQVKEDFEAGLNVQVIVVGKQGSKFVSRLEGVDVIGAYHDFPERPTANDIHPILSTVVAKYRKQEIDAVDIIYTDYISSIRQEVKHDRLLPAAFEDVELPSELDEAVFEPSPQAVLESITERLIEAQLSQALLESQASEQSMRMMAMKNATDNANELVDDLNLAFNTARQASITQELAEITGGAEAMK